MPCDPSLHDGALVPATKLVRAVDLVHNHDEMYDGTIFRSKRSIDSYMFACCDDHIGHAVEFVMDNNNSSRVVVQRHSEEK